MAHDDVRLLRDKYEDPAQLQSVYEAWDQMAPETRRALLELLPGDWSFTGRRMLDFGCGSGRTLRHFLEEAETGEFWGVDIDPGYIEEVQQLCPPLRAELCGEAPPLRFESSSFDLAWAISVFTHLTDQSIPWLLELHRVLKRGGLLIATYIGRWNSEYVAGEPWDEDRVGMNVLRHTQPWDRGGPTVLMSDWWVRAHWGRLFEVVDVAPNIHNMSWALLRRREVELTVADIEAPADDRREYFAARHNLCHAQKEIEVTQALSQRWLDDLRDEYESSISWRLTRPLRSARQKARALSDRPSHRS